MSIPTKTFANRGLARAAIATAKNTWTPPPVVSIRPGPNHARMLAAIGPQEMATDAYELNNGKWAVIANHPNFTGETIEESDIKRPPVELPAQAQAGKAKL
jgi:hypothetical protein